jgi:formate-dependent nitrite reductase membrane component NrfD
MVLLNRDREAPFATTRVAMLAPVVLSVGMGALFLDLENKLHVFRFYTAFKWASPMSWGAWILLVIYPVSILQVLSTLRTGFPPLAALLDMRGWSRGLLQLCERYRSEIAIVAIPFAAALGIYTGILLSAFSARPFWNSGVLGPLFLASGLSAAAALIALLARQRHERHMFARIDLVLILVELALVGLFLVNLSTGTEQQILAARQILGGEFTLVFWGLFIGFGLLVPLGLELLELNGRARSIAVLAPVLVLVGGYVLRQVMLDVGQVSSWTQYPSQYSEEALQRLD